MVLGVLCSSSLLRVVRSSIRIVTEFVWYLDVTKAAPGDMFDNPYLGIGQTYRNNLKRHLGTPVPSICWPGR